MSLKGFEKNSYPITRHDIPHYKEQSDIPTYIYTFFRFFLFFLVIHVPWLLLWAMGAMATHSLTHATQLHTLPSHLSHCLCASKMIKILFPSFCVYIYMFRREEHISE